MHQNSLQDKVQEVIEDKESLGQIDQKKLVIHDVLEALGKPPSLHEVTACNVFEDKWRVNVWTKEYTSKDSIAPSYKIAHTYFCTLQDNWIVDSNPEIKKLY